MAAQPPPSCGRGSLMNSWTFGTVATITAAPVRNSDRAKERPVSFNNLCGQKRPFISPAGVLMVTADTRGEGHREQQDTARVGWTNEGLL